MNIGYRPMISRTHGGNALKGHHHHHRVSPDEHEASPDDTTSTALTGHHHYHRASPDDTSPDYITNTMPQSLTKVYIHLVFSTKYREPTIGDDVKDELYAYLGGICQTLECNPIRVGGYYDHIHILCILSKKIALMKLMEEVKKGSSKWMKTKGQAYHNFYWQDGYGAFSVNPSQIGVVERYIANQYEHHRQLSFQDECRGIYQKYEMAYDERYVWD